MVDRIHFNVRLEETRLVVVGVRVDGTKELVAITDGHPESPDSWGDVLRDPKRRGMPAPMSGSRAPGLAMAFRLIEAAQSRWRSVNAPHLVAPVWAGAKFEKGVLIGRTATKDQEAAT